MMPNLTLLDDDTADAFCRACDTPLLDRLECEAGYCLDCCRALQIGPWLETFEAELEAA